MIIAEVITRADILRPNKLPEEQKYDAVMKLEAQVAELMCKGTNVYRGSEWVEFLERNYPDGKTAELLMPYPNDDIYVLYLTAIIDFYNQELDKYQNDSVIFEERKQAAFAHIRRENEPTGSGTGFKVM